jgi:predicted nuclease of predicted toxin-antitoxin system
MRNVLDKRYIENQRIHFVLGNFFFENLAVYEIMWKNTGTREATDDNIIRRMIDSHKSFNV